MRAVWVFSVGSMLAVSGASALEGVEEIPAAAYLARRCAAIGEALDAVKADRCRPD